REVLRALLEGARKSVPKEDAEYLDLAERMIAAGTLSERIRAALEPFAEDDDAFTEEARKVYIELMDCLETNEPWGRRGL
ncbi:MAG: hypothetical protein M3409_01765, partial [Gemmatimonadota bacterium]|nr:hypothetical protein [Gemmatimonadota bacterium]